MSEHDATDPAATPNPVFARDAFVSYANQDTGVADAVCASLERRGLSCWIAPRDVVPGALYADSIVRAINGTKLMVLVLSQHSVASPHVSKEIERASSKRRPIIALRIDTAPLTPALEYFLSESQWVDATKGGLDAALTRLSEAVRVSLLAPAHALAAPTGSSGAAVTAAPPSGPRAARHSPWVYAVPVAAMALTFAYRIADKWLHPPVAAPVAATGGSDRQAAAVDKSVAVLPFEDLSENKDQAYFSDGLSGELIDLLAKVPGLRVPARTSSFYFKGKQATLQEIAKALNVTHVLEGTVRKSGQTLRITTDLVRVDTGTPMWSETYDRKLDDIFKIQDDIAGSVVSALKVSLLGGTVPRATPTANSAAYTAYLNCWKGGDTREDPRPHRNPAKQPSHSIRILRRAGSGLPQSYKRGFRHLVTVIAMRWCGRRSTQPSSTRSRSIPRVAAPTWSWPCCTPHSIWICKRRGKNCSLRPTSIRSCPSAIGRRAISPTSRVDMQTP
jgi:TolB-like protein